MPSNHVSIFGKFRGLCYTGLSEPHLQGLARHFNCILRPPPDDLLRFSREECVIKDEESFLRFVARIPEKVMDFVPSPKPSSDPLLRRPKVDFDQNMILVIISHEPNCFIDLDIEKVEVTSNRMHVHCVYAAPGPVVQKVINCGAYCAVAVPLFDGEIEFVPRSQPLPE